MSEDDDTETGATWDEMADNVRKAFNDHTLPNLVDQGRLSEEEANDIRAAMSDFRSEEDIDRAMKAFMDNMGDDKDS